MVPFFKHKNWLHHSFKHLTIANNMQPNTTQTTNTQTITTTQTPDYDFENDDHAFYNFIDFGIASNGGRLWMKWNSIYRNQSRDKGAKPPFNPPVAVCHTTTRCSPPDIAL